MPRSNLLRISEKKWPHLLRIPEKTWYNLLRIPEKIGTPMYEDLVAEYLEYELPPYITRERAVPSLPSPQRRNLITTLIGVRRCGKTYLLFQMMDELVRAGVSRERVFYFPFDDDRLGELDSSTATRILDAYYALVPDAAEGCYLFFDEIQDVPGWNAFARRVAEQNAVTLVLTGSSSKLLSSEITTKLRGRSLSYEVWPLGFGEFCRFHDIDCDVRGGAFTSRRAGRLAQAFRSYLDIGGFPAVQRLDITTRSRLLQQYADEIMTKDVLERFGNASYRAGRMLALGVLRSTGLKFSVNKQVKAMRSSGISLSNESAYALLDDFADAHLAYKVSDYSLSIKENPKSTYKVYSVDQGLSYAVAPANHVDIGQRFETAVFMELKRRYGDLRDRVIARYASAQCPEVDFIVGDVMLGAEYELIQVALESGAGRSGASGPVSEKYRSEVGNLVKAMGETGLVESYLVTLDEQEDVFVETGTVHIVPAWKWFLNSSRSLG